MTNAILESLIVQNIDLFITIKECNFIYAFAADELLHFSNSGKFQLYVNQPLNFTQLI